MRYNGNILDSELIYGNDCPYIDIQWQKGYIFVSNAVFRLIGKPSGICLLWNAATATNGAVWRNGGTTPQTIL